MKKIANGLARHLAELALIGGAAAVAIGAGMIFLPAGLIAGGGLVMAGAVLLIWGEDGGNGGGAA